MKCPNRRCRFEIAPHLVRCVVCGADVGFPNVRAAEDPREKAALTDRYKQAVAESRMRKCEPKVRAFLHAVNNSQAVINRSLGAVSHLCSSDTELYSTFSKSVGAEARLPQNNAWDIGRASVEGALFPEYRDEIRFGTLTINGQGAKGYGEVSVLLKDESIRTRTTVFEENPFTFMRRHDIVAGAAIPPGYRAIWADRGQLAVAKLEAKLSPTTPNGDFAGLLLGTGPGTDTEMIEVHVYGPIHRRGISEVVLDAPRRTADRALLAAMKESLVAIGAKVRVLS